MIRFVKGLLSTESQSSEVYAELSSRNSSLDGRGLKACHFATGVPSS